MAYYQRYSGSSETTREVTTQCALHSRSAYSKDDVDWLIGFTEGDGCFYTNGKRLWFILIQAEARVLYKARAILGFGRIQHTTQGYF
jgi:hypothetical protein